MKGTKVDGIYSADPVKHKDAVFYPELSYQQVLTENLRVMDTAAIALARESQIPVMVFSILNPHGIRDALQGKGRFTIIR
jgi:uridylate kinase